MIIRLENHPNDPDTLVAYTPPEMAHAMGRLGFARRSPKLNGYLIPAKYLDQLRTFARAEDAQVVDERDRGGEEKFSGPLPECRSCGMPAPRKASMTLTRCQSCGDAWHPVVFETPGVTAAPRLQCAGCGRRQQHGFAFCGECGARMPDLPAPAPRPVDLPVPGRAANQDPIPVAQTIAELDLEEPQRERYP